MNQNFNDKIDKGLVGNKLIEEAIKGLQEEATQEMLAHTLTVIRKRMTERTAYNCCRAVIWLTANEYKRRKNGRWTFVVDSVYRI